MLYAETTGAELLLSYIYTAAFSSLEALFSDDAL